MKESDEKFLSNEITNSSPSNETIHKTRVCLPVVYSNAYLSKDPLAVVAAIFMYLFVDHVPPKTVDEYMVAVIVDMVSSMKALLASEEGVKRSTETANKIKESLDGKIDFNKHDVLEELSEEVENPIFMAYVVFRFLSEFPEALYIAATMATTYILMQDTSKSFTNLLEKMKEVYADPSFIRFYYYTNVVTGSRVSIH